MEEPVIQVGILTDTRIRFVADGGFLTGGEPCPPGEQEVTLHGGRLCWQGRTYDALQFDPAAPAASFVLRGVVIGIGFHWERREDQRFQGALRFIPGERGIVAVNLIKAEDYLTSVIASEMSAAASPELLKAHAVISRSWLLSQLVKDKKSAGAHPAPTCTETEHGRIRWYDRDDHTLFDVCADDHCQRYQGITRTYGHIGRVRQAIGETRGEVLTHGGRLCDARFSKCCGGATEEFPYCWEDVHHPYLAARLDRPGCAPLPDLTREEEAVRWIGGRPEAFCNTTDRRILEQVLNGYDQETADFYRWTVRYTQAEVTDLVRRRGGIDVGTVTGLVPLERGRSGRISRLLIRGTRGDFTIGKELEIRRTLSESHLYSSAFYVEREGDAFTLHGAGWGHGVGLCQIGAAVMGERGYRYDEILRHYYPGAELERHY